MTIANENNRVDLVASGGQTTFAYNFKIEANDEIAVYLTPDGNTPSDSADILTLTTDYTLTGVGDAGGGNIILTAGSFPAGATADDSVVAVRAIDYDQPDEYVIGQDNAENLEASLDRMTMRVQRVNEVLDRCVKLGITGPAGFEMLASAVALLDSAGYYASDNVEAAFAEIRPQVGTWTPTLEGGTVAGTEWSYGEQVGNYVRIGKLLLLYGNVSLQFGGVGADASGDLRIGGLASALQLSVASILNSSGSVYALNKGILSSGYSALHIVPATNTAFKIIESGHATSVAQDVQISSLIDDGSDAFKFSIIAEIA